MPVTVLVFYTSIRRLEVAVNSPASVVHLPNFNKQWRLFASEGNCTCVNVSWGNVRNWIFLGVYGWFSSGWVNFPGGWGR